MIFLVSFLVANLQAQNSPAKPEETETKENHAAQSDQVDGPASTISVDVVVEDREEDEWHDAEGQRGPRGWEAALRRGPQ
ncbi:hypothetical protein ACHAP1_004495 [Verticillium nonalfalfae]